ncbi:MAG: sterol desaturase family protein [Burkholderiaceae bacterium]|nr:sterol desaturase family protein [Burkholderiaceae bacterium]MDP3131613.1 sterol desaturase family protein [Burkholderiaceae bacterium]
MDTPTIADWVSQHEMAVRLGAFALTFLAVALWELAAPQRQLKLPRALRWRSNLGLVLVNTVLLRVAFPTAAVGVADLAETQSWGVLNVWQPPMWAAVLLAVVALDFVVWLQHVMVHAVPALWRLHRVHHADLDYDLTTGARFHPLEIGLSMGIKFAAIVLLGAPVLAVMVFEVLLSSCAMFNHGNIRLSAPADRVLRWFMVTPDMHRVHHSVEDDESNCNFGFNLTWWDRLLGTYREQPRAGQQGMTLGIRDHHDPQEVAHLGGMLRLPFVAANAGYAINRRDWTPPP